MLSVAAEAVLTPTPEMPRHPHSAQATMVFYVPPHSACDVLDDVVAVLGAERRCCAARELTKVFETFYRGSVAEVLQGFRDKPPRGELTLIVEGSSEAELLEASHGEVRADLDVQHSTEPQRICAHS